MLCYVMLCYVMLCYVMLCYVMLRYVMLCYVCFSASKLLADISNPTVDTSTKPHGAVRFQSYCYTTKPTLLTHNAANARHAVTLNLQVLLSSLMLHDFLTVCHCYHHSNITTAQHNSRHTWEFCASTDLLPT